MINVYCTRHEHSKVVGRAFAEGCRGRVLYTDWGDGRRLYELFAYEPLQPGPCAMYGILRGTGALIKQAQALGRDFWYLDHGYFRAGHYDGYYRVTRNALQHDGSGAYPTDRLESLGLEFAPWKRGGRNIVIAPLSQSMGGFHNVNAETWLKAVKYEIREHTDRPIVIKHKDGKPIEPILDDAWCLVTHSSNTAVEAVMAGVPAIVLGESGARAVCCTDLAMIETVPRPDREQWAANLAYQQFTLDEMRSGFAWRCLNERGLDDMESDDEGLRRALGAAG